MTQSSDEFAEHRRQLKGRLRAAFLSGAGEQSRPDHGRGLTEGEPRGVTAEYPGDLPTQ